MVPTLNQGVLPGLRGKLRQLAALGDMRVHPAGLASWSLRRCPGTRPAAAATNTSSQTLAVQMHRPNPLPPNRKCHISTGPTQKKQQMRKTTFLSVFNFKHVHPFIISSDAPLEVAISHCTKIPIRLSMQPKQFASENQNQERPLKNPW